MTLMHISSRAPELSAACKRVLSWIIALAPSFRRRALDNAHQGPRLAARQRPALRDRDGVARAALILLVVREQLGRAPHVLAVGRVLDQPLDRDGDGLVHLVADDRAGQRLRRVLFRFNRVGHHLLHACAPSISRRTVFTRAIFPLAFACWSGRAGCPAAAAMRRLNCSRRSSSSSARSSGFVLPRRAFRLRARSLMFLLPINAPACARTRSGPKAWPPPA